jgi:hypothetical protein
MTAAARGCSKSDAVIRDAEFLAAAPDFSVGELLNIICINGIALYASRLAARVRAADRVPR